MIIAEFDKTLWGKTYKVTICEHIKEVFELALRYKLNFNPDYLHDEVECPECGARAQIDDIIDWIENRQTSNE